MFGSHCIKTYNQMQETIALSSGESEFYGIVKAAAMGLGSKGLMDDPVGVSTSVRSGVLSKRVLETPGVVFGHGASI